MKRVLLSLVVFLISIPGLQVLQATPRSHLSGEARAHHSAAESLGQSAVSVFFNY